MRSLYLRIWLTVVAALALFALVAGWMLQRHLEQERVRFESVARERTEAWADLLQRSLPGPDAPRAEQEAALREWALRLRVPMAMDDAQGRRVATTEAYARREADAGPMWGRRVQAVRLDDGRTLWVFRPPPRGVPGMGQPPPGGGRAWWMPPAWADGWTLVLLLALLFAGVAAGAWPVVRRLTRRLEALKQGVEVFGSGRLDHRVAEDGRDEVAALGASFNRAAARIQGLVQSHKSLLANASHELRSPLARLKMALAMLDDASPAQRESLRREITADIAELDALVEEVLMASRLDGGAGLDRRDEVDLLALAAEEASRTGAAVQGDAVVVTADERLVRRALRNLLENARRYGGSEVEVQVLRRDAGAEVLVCDRGPGVPEAHRERIFEPFFRLPGHAERAGGVGLGLSLVRQIALGHGGQVRCEARPGGGSCFRLRLPLRPAPSLEPAPSAGA